MKYHFIDQAEKCAGKPKALLSANGEFWGLMQQHEIIEIWDLRITPLHGLIKPKWC